ncbi:hypothetical protein PAMP_002385 [Pampus punctatissimus]
MAAAASGYGAYREAISHHLSSHRPARSRLIGPRERHGDTEEMKELEEDLTESLRKYLAAALSRLTFLTLPHAFHSNTDSVTWTPLLLCFKGNRRFVAVVMSPGSDWWYDRTSGDKQEIHHAGSDINKELEHRRYQDARIHPSTSN